MEKELDLNTKNLPSSKNNSKKTLETPRKTGRGPLHLQ